ncbi:alkaline phosphatase family protein [Ornithinimicrobium sp. Arc0846-15]|nr:alkaline phosphatase family protein [Ornithinimicrobium laminariae]
MTRDVGWALPPYDVTLADTLPAALASMGVDLPSQAESGRRSGLVLPAARNVVVVLADGLGAAQLERRRGHAPFLRNLKSAASEVRSGFPSTTAVSLSSLGTGRLPGEHGITAWQTKVPGADRLLNHLSWADGPDPRAYQPVKTLLQEAHETGVYVTTVSQPQFQGSGLTTAALLGGDYVGVAKIDQRVPTVARCLRAQDNHHLLYLYWPEIDKAGHVYGPDSQEWTGALEVFDAAMAQLSRSLPPETLLVITADHGMIEAPPAKRYDLVERSELAQDVLLLGGEPRAPYVYVAPGQQAAVKARWTEVLGDDAYVVDRDEAVERGWYGPMRDGVLERLGDLIVLMRGRATVVDSSALRPNLLALPGLHGSVTDEESLIPMLTYLS